MLVINDDNLKYTTKIIGDTACPSCKKTGRDRTGNHLMIFSDGSTYCNRCEYSGEVEDKSSLTYSSSGRKNNKTPEDIKQSIDEVLTCPFDYLRDREITKATAEYFGVRVGLSQQDGRTVTSHFYPYFAVANTSSTDPIPCGFKRRIIKDKFIYSIGNTSTVKLFGQDKCKSGGKKLFITEGECDTMALFQVLKDSNTGTKWASLNPNVVSLIHGSSAAVKDIAANKDFVISFSEIVLVFDQDEAGDKAVSEVTKLLPQVKVARYDLNDPNEMLQKGRSLDLKAAVMFTAKVETPDGIKTIDDVFEAACTKPTWGISYPWPSMTKATYGIRLGEVHTIGAAPKIGKTDFQHQLSSHLIHHHGETVGMFDIENPAQITAKKLASKYAMKPFNRPDIEFEIEELKEALNALRGHVKFYDSSGCRQWDSVRTAIRFMAVEDGIKYFMLDPLTAFISSMSSSEANDALNYIMTDISRMKQELNITFWLFSHLNSPPSSKLPHDRGGKVLASQFTGSRAMEKWSDYIWGIERNKDPELSPEERNTSQFVLLGDRSFGNSCKFPVHYSQETGTYLENICQTSNTNTKEEF